MRALLTFPLKAAGARAARIIVHRIGRFDIDNLPIHGEHAVPRGQHHVLFMYLYCSISCRARDRR